MVYLKSCPKCLGDLTMGQDGYGTFISCLQCGFMRDIDVKSTITATSKSPAVKTFFYRQKGRLPKAA